MILSQGDADNEPIDFEGIGKCYFIVGPFREPRDGEFYFSQYTSSVYLAPKGLSLCCCIVIPTHQAVQRLCWKRGRVL